MQAPLKIAVPQSRYLRCVDTDITPAEKNVVDAAAAWAADFVGPRSEGWERDRRCARDAFDSAAAHGFTGLYVGQDHGGTGLGAVAYARVFEEIAAADMGVGFMLTVHNNYAVSLASHLTGPTRNARLEAALTGSVLGGFGLTEPDVGSDAAKITTTATKMRSGWKLDGAKAWVSNGAELDVLAVYATVDSAAGHRGIGAFLVDVATPGVVVDDPYHLLGAHSLGTTSIRLDGCLVPDDAMFIRPGQGFSAALAGIDVARIIVGAMSCGMMRTALSTATQWVRGRQAFGARLADLQNTRFVLADVATDLEATRLLTYRAARLLDDGEPATIAAAHAKKFATRTAERRIADCMQVMGAEATRQSGALPRHLAASRLTNYLDGATEIQNVVIARALLDGE